MAALLFLAVWLRGCARRDPGAVTSADLLTERRLDTATTLEELLLQTQSGLQLHCLLRRPADTLHRSPTVILVGGYRTGRRAAAVIGERWRGVAFACDYPWPNPGASGALRLLARLPRVRSELVSTPLALHSAASWLLQHPAVDTARLGAVGASLGVPFVIAWASGDGRVGPIALLYGGAPLDDLLDVAMRRSVSVAWLRQVLAAAGQLALDPLRPEVHASDLWAHPTFTVIASDDERIPASLGEALAELARGRVMRVAGRHMTATDDELLAMLTDSTLAWLESVWGTATRPR